MDGEAQPKFGLMVSLLLMNLTAIALFFFATPAPRDSPKKQTDNSENVPMQADMVVAGDVQTKVDALIDDIKGSVKAVVSSKRMNKVDDRSPRTSLAKVQTLQGKVELRVVTPSKTVETSDGPAEPPLAIALKKFVGSTKSGVRLVFEGLRNGYTRRTRDSPADNTDTKIARPLSKAVDPPSSPQNTKSLAHERSPAQKLPKPGPSFYPEEDSNCLNLDAIPTEVVMDALSRAQTRTNELIHVFNKRVVPAIERMNERVAEAIRLEKNLDSYTSTLINAINSVVCPNMSEANLGRKQSKSGTSAVKKPRHSKPFSSELSLMRDPQIRDYMGSHSKGERSTVNKRPVFKTLAARCWHTRHRKLSNKIVKHENRPREPTMQQGDEKLHLKKKHYLISEFGSALDVPELTERIGTKGDEESGNIDLVKDNCEDITTKMGDSSSVSFTEPSCQRTIGIEDVLALTSSLEQSSDQGIQSERDLPFQSPLNSDPSMSSGMACRSCVTENAKPEATEQDLTEDESGNLSRNLEHVGPENSEMPEDSAMQGRPKEGALCSELSIVCDSRIRGFTSSFQNEVSPLGVHVHAPLNEDQNVRAHSQTAKGFHNQGESNHPISLSGNVENTMELVNIFQRLNFKQKEVAMESVCLLVLRIFEAWTESQRSISSLGLSKISLTSWPSSEEVSSQSNRPCTAICRSTIGSDKEHKSMDSCVPKDGTSEYLHTAPPNEITTDWDPVSAEISRTMVHNVVEAAEVQIAEKSLVGLRTSIHRNPPSKGEIPKSCLDSADRSGFGDISDTVTTMNEALAASLMSRSHESVKVSKESSAATFYTGQPELSEDAFYECTSTLSAGTCGSHELDVKDSSTIFLERIQEEETKAQKLALTVEPEAAGSSFSIESWLTDSGEELITAKETLNSENSSCGGGTDDEAYPCSSQELSADEFKTGKSKKDRSKKKKWTTKFLHKFLKKNKPSSLPSVALPMNASRSRSDSVLKPAEQYADIKDGQSTQ